MRLGEQQWTGLVMLRKHQHYRMTRRIHYNVMCNVERQQFNIIINNNKVGDGGALVVWIWAETCVRLGSGGGHV